MRYTTVIDITDMPTVYRNVHCRLLYLHMALKSGWHDNDRDRLTASYRTLAADTGLTVSAVRHAIKVLTAAQLISRDDETWTWTVRKWILDAPPTPRPKKQQAAGAIAASKLADARDKEAKEYQARVLAAVRACTREELTAWLAELEEGRSLRHHGVYINSNQANIAWLKSIIIKT